MAGLDPMVYDSSLRPACDQEDVGAQSMIQSIVTTPTGPPDEVQTEPWWDATSGGVTEVRFVQQVK